MGMLMLALAISDSVNSLVGFIARYPIDYNDPTFCLVEVLSWIPGTANRINDTTLLLPRYPLVLAQGLIAPARGLLNSFAFFYTIGKSPKDLRESGEGLTDPHFVIPRKQSYFITTSISDHDELKTTANQKSNAHSDVKPISSLNNWISSLAQTSAPKLVPADTFEAYLLKLNASGTVSSIPDDQASMISKKNAKIDTNNRNSAESLQIYPI
ncbi:hypothetical protein HDV01_001415 [Terramyces sp. JEL0728]|nr:hypothetical protein HDV01_001415 [Terramyces sp. JEL0728]